MIQHNSTEPKPSGVDGNPRFLAYAIPRAKADFDSHVLNGDDFTILDAPIGPGVSFLDYDGLVIFGGTFDKFERGLNWAEMVCSNQADLDFRERELYTALQHGKPALILLHFLPTHLGFRAVDSKTDLFRRIAAQLDIHWTSHERPYPHVEAIVPEFRDYVSRFGAGYVSFPCDKHKNDFIKPICKCGDEIHGLAIADKLFFLPCVIPQSAGQVREIITTAAAAVIAYRKRVSREQPTWVNDFGFQRERELQAELASLQKKAVMLEGEINKYAEWKSALCLQSEPLVEIVVRMLDHFFGLKLTVDDKKIEDATLRDDKETILAIFEIKGVKGNFTRSNVNQVDSHRERLGMPTTTPGVLIMNTLMDAAALRDKDQPPHPDIIAKAAADNVLLVRTLDLLRYSDAVEEGTLTKEQFRNAVLGEAGWLKVEDGTATIIRS